MADGSRRTWSRRFIDALIAGFGAPYLPLARGVDRAGDTNEVGTEALYFDAEERRPHETY
jgi:hypothetical protein